MSICNEIQQKMAELGFNQVIENQDDLKHIKSCQGCQDYQKACEEMNQAMDGMSHYDAEDALVESTLNSILSLQEQTKKPKSLLNAQWASGLAASFMLISLIALFPYNSISNYGLFTDIQKDSSVVRVSDEEMQKIRQRKEALSKNKQESSGIEFTQVDVVEEVNNKHRRIPKKSAPMSDITIRQNKEEKTSGLTLSELVESFKDSEFDNSSGRIQEFESNNNGKKELERITISESMNTSQEQKDAPIVESLEEDSRGVKLNSEGIGQVLVYPNDAKDQDSDQRQDGYARGIEEDLVIEVNPESESPNDTTLLDSNNDTRKKLNEKIRQKTDLRRKEMRDNANNDDEQDVLLDKITLSGSRIKRDSIDDKVVAEEEKKSGVVFTIASSKRSTTDGLYQDNLEITESPSPLSPAKKFITELNSLDNLAYQNATGYWANNYLPGDANMRLLAGNLLKNDANIESIVEQNRQPFDYPTNSALDVYLSSDHAYVDAQNPTRMKLQVGIQASNRKGGHRSAMNIGLVFDVKDNNSETLEKIKALLLALLKSKQSSDTISVIVAGANGGELIQAKEFRYGTIQAMMNRLASSEIDKQSVTLSLQQAIKLANVNLQKNDDPTASLGSSVVMLITDKTIDDITALETIVHQNALNGISLSTVSLGDDNHQQLNQLALAGQGHARVLQNSNDANRVIDAELLDSSRAVARALRLRIRLAKGVKLIKVLDSYNLNEVQAQRVRDAENSLDQRLSKNLGIQSDRGEDEEGIQIVIPSFFAGDTHVVILDVVVSNPGAIADVSMRYKDLLYLRNAISRNQLSLGNDEKSLGPLQLNVLKNVLASRFANVIKKASNALKKGNELTALSQLSKLLELYQSMRIEFPSWNHDAEIIKDEKLIQHYINLINQNSNSDAPQFNFIVDSMQYISWRKNITQSK